MAQQVLSPPVISPFPSLTSTTGSVDVRQLQVLEKLQQLRLWQQQQQEHLLKQQQYELSSLKNEQDAIRKRLGLIKDTDNTNESLKRCQLTPPLVQSVTSAQDTSNEYVVSSETSPQSGIMPSIKQDTPFYGSLQPEGHTISGSSLKSTHSADSGMLSGQTSAVDVLQRPSQSSEEQLDHSSGFQTPESNILTDSEPEETHLDQNNKGINMDTRDHCPLVPSSDNLPHDDIPVRPGVGPGSASTFEELLEKKLQLYEHTTHVLQPQPTLVRCPSEDSFLVRKEQRKKEEEAELAEFEMLERAAQESSFSSQCSIVMRALGNSVLSSSPKSLHPINKSLARNRDGRSLSLSPVDKRSVTPQSLTTDNKLTEAQNANSMSSLPIDLKAPLQNEICASQNSRKSMTTSDHGIIPATTVLLPAVQEDDEDSDLDSTLRSKHGYQFGDEEEWDSFNADTPKQTKPLSCVTKKSLITSPGQYVGQNRATVNDTIAKNGNAVKGGPGRVRKVCILPPADKMEVVDSSDSDSTDAENSVIEYPIIQSQSQYIPKSTSPHLTSVQPTSSPTSAYPSSNAANSSITSSAYLAALPPPSTLVAKLFPSLKKERETAKAKMLEKVSTNAQQTNSTKRTSPPTGTPTLSLPNGLDVQVKEKLAQLEREIERFKTENAALEKLHIEKEEGLLYMKRQIADFEHEKQQEIANFEKYKQEEIKKLKKERRVFETYQREARSLRDKKDKEEIMALKQELEEVKEELHQKESRWSSTLSRYRLRIDNLEAQNEELQNDLKMMEEQRLLQWQQQLDSKKATGQQKQKRFLNTSLSPVKTEMLGLEPEPDELTEDEICELLDHPQVKHNKIQIYKYPQQTKSTVVKTKQRRKSDPPHKPPFINESKAPPTIKKPKIDKENKKPKVVHNSSPTQFRTQPNQKLTQTTMKPSMKKTVNRPPLSNVSSTTKTPLLKHSENIIINKSEGAPQHVLQRKDHCSPEVEKSQPLVVRKEIEGMESESECSIIEVRAVDMVTEGKDEVTSDSDLSEKADAIINLMLGPEEQENDVTKRTTIQEDLCHTRDNVTTSQSKTVRFDISSSTSPVDNLPTDLVSVHEQTKTPQTNTITNTINITKETQEEDGSKVVLFTNGTRKVISANGQTSTVYFFNGDIKQIQSDGTIVYYYSSSHTTHTTQLDGTEILEFSNGQSEKHHPNGCKEIHFPDGTIRHMLLDGKEKIVFPDGTIQQVLSNGNRTIDFPDGQREVHTKEHKRREYPDGTVKTVYPDGHQETKYANGRLRVKDKDGQVIVDRMDTPPTYMST